MAITVASFRAFNSVTILAVFSSIVTQFLLLNNTFYFFRSTTSYQLKSINKATIGD
jgi:hypothetical protein